jgi:16S rRNA (cytidine1402-2'-O)-methyltransferase
MAGRLILCATPIGNLDDASPRLGATLRDADVIYAEDTRRARVLLDRLDAGGEVRSYFVGNEETRADELRRRLESGDSAVLITDAGSPSVADPGVSAVRAAVAAGAEVSTVPGPSAVTAAIAVAGLGGDQFVFEGFLPRSGRDRQRRLERLRGESRPAVLFVAPKRLGVDLADLADACGGDRQVVVARELTKLHEEVWRGDLAAAAEVWAEGGRGEITLVLEGKESTEVSIEVALEAVEREIATGSSLSAAVRSVAEDLEVSRRRLYEAAIESDRSND